MDPFKDIRPYKDSEVKEVVLTGINEEEINSRTETTRNSGQSS